MLKAQKEILSFQPSAFNVKPLFHPCRSVAKQVFSSIFNPRQSAAKHNCFPIRGKASNLLYLFNPRLSAAIRGKT
jgi:hypothetical protein